MPANRNPQVKYTQLFIHNEFVNSASGKTYPTVNPTTGDTISRVQEGDRVDVDRAVAAARNAFNRKSNWRTMDASNRGRLLNKLAQLIERDAEQIASLETLNNGKPYTQAQQDVQQALNYLQYNAGLADKVNGRTIPSDGQQLSFTRFEAIGVVGAIIPFNSPLLTLVTKLGQALAAGNTLVVKPAEETPLTALHLASLVREAGIPAGVVNVIPGLGQTAGNALSNHPDVNLITFTGSNEVGQQLQVQSGQTNMKRLILELSGRSPLVVFEDADLDQAVAAAHYGVFNNNGQVYAASSRIYVQERVYDQFVQKSVQLANQRVVGDPFDERTQQGSQINEQHLNKILKTIENAKREGAKLQAGGQRLGNKGYYVQPTVFSDVKDDMSLAKEEVFGPVQAILKFQSFNEVLDRCNALHYGLAAGVFTNNLNRALDFAQGVQAASVYINNYNQFVPQLSNGGYNMSGNGARENGEDGIKEYMELKTISIQMEQTLS